MMETAQPTLKNGRNVWGQVNMPKGEFEERIKSIRKEMKKGGIDILLLYGNGFNEYGNSCYISNFITRLTRGALVVLSKKDEIALIFEGSSRGLPSAKTTTWVEEVRACGDVSKECVKYLKEKKLIPSSVGFAGLRQFMPDDQLEFLSQSLNQCKIVNWDPILRDMRMVKSQREGDQIRRSSRILTHTFNFLAETSFTNMSERMLEAMLYRETRLEGAEDFRMLIGKPGGERWAFRPAEAEEISSEGVIIIYLALAFERYWAEAIRTFILKEASFADATPDGVNSFYGKAMDGMKPGKKISQFYKEVMAEIKKRGFECITDYGLGHGIGLSPQEFPVITKKEHTIFKEGMCLTLRLLVKDKGLGAVMIGNTLHLTKHGPELLTS